MPDAIEKIVSMETAVEDDGVEGTLRVALVVEGVAGIQYYAESFDAASGLPSEAMEAICDNNELVYPGLP